MTDADLSDRLDRIEAILRDHGMHEPTCPIRVQKRANEGPGDMFWYATGPCDCWLSETETDTP